MGHWTPTGIESKDYDDDVFPAVILLFVYKYDVYGLAMFFCYNHRYYKAYDIYGYNTSLVHLRYILKVVMKI